MARIIRNPQESQTLHLANFQCGASQLPRKTVSPDWDEDYCDPIFKEIQHEHVDNRLDDEVVELLLPAPETDDKIREEVISS